MNETANNAWASIVKDITSKIPKNDPKAIERLKKAARYIEKSVEEPEEKYQVRNGSDLAVLFADLKVEEQEHFVVVTFDAAHHVIGRHEVTIGLVNQSLVHPREAFKHAIADNAVAVAFAHNHPGGSCEPSAPDVRTTIRLVEAGELLGIKVLDHLVISRNGWRSCRQMA